MKNRGDHAPVLSKSTVLIQPLLTAPTKGPYYQTLSTNPTEPGGFYNQPPLIVPKKLWQTPLNFDDPDSFNFAASQNEQRRSHSCSLLPVLLTATPVIRLPPSSTCSRRQALFLNIHSFS